MRNCAEKCATDILIRQAHDNYANLDLCLSKDSTDLFTAREPFCQGEAVILPTKTWICLTLGRLEKNTQHCEDSVCTKHAILCSYCHILINCWQWSYQMWCWWSTRVLQHSRDGYVVPLSSLVFKEGAKFSQRRGTSLHLSVLWGITWLHFRLHPEIRILKHLHTVDSC